MSEQELQIPTVERKDIQHWGDVCEVKAVNEEEREVLHLISTKARDRAGDIVNPKGLDLKNFKKNPVVLVNHDYRVESIIGKAVVVERFCRSRQQTSHLERHQLHHCWFFHLEYHQVPERLQHVNLR